MGLDGFIARTDGTLDFLDPWAGENAGFEELLASVDALVMGRKTYDIASALAVRGIGHIYVDGDAIVQQCLRAGLIQRLIISRGPVLIGAGIPPFAVSLMWFRYEHLQMAMGPMLITLKGPCAFT